MRGFLLDGLSTNHGKIIALLISAAFFSILHFNIAQIVPSFICGIILGLLYYLTDSIFSCILAHIGYNTLSDRVIMLPIINHYKQLNFSAIELLRYSTFPYRKAPPFCPCGRSTLSKHCVLLPGRATCLKKTVLANMGKLS